MKYLIAFIALIALALIGVVVYFSLFSDGSGTTVSNPASVTVPSSEGQVNLPNPVSPPENFNRVISQIEGEPSTLSIPFTYYYALNSEQTVLTLELNYRACDISKHEFVYYSFDDTEIFHHSSSEDYSSCPLIIETVTQSV